MKPATALVMMLILACARTEPRVNPFDNGFDALALQIATQDGSVVVTWDSSRAVDLADVTVINDAPWDIESTVDCARKESCDTFRDKIQPAAGRWSLKKPWPGGAKKVNVRIIANLPEKSITIGESVIAGDDFDGDGITLLDCNDSDSGVGACLANWDCLVSAASAECNPDECLVENGGCDTNAACENIVNGRACKCKPGYAGDGESCVDIDECQTDNGGCDSHAVCENTPGGRTCRCKGGYSGNGEECTDVNECLTANGGCDSNSTCTNTVGGRTCTCKQGWSGDGVTCSDINECALGNACQGQWVSCENTQGSFRCYCGNGQSMTSTPPCTEPGTLPEFSLCNYNGSSWKAADRCASGLFCSSLGICLGTENYCPRGTTKQDVLNENGTLVTACAPYCDRSPVYKNGVSTPNSCGSETNPCIVGECTTYRFTNVFVTCNVLTCQNPDPASRF